MSYWTLSRMGREYYKVEIVTTPPLSSWEISFDRGLTWHETDFDGPTNEVRVLVSGPDFVPPTGDTTESITVLNSVMPYIRATDNPEIIVRATPRIDIV